MERDVIDGAFDSDPENTRMSFVSFQNMLFPILIIKLLIMYCKNCGEKIDDDSKFCSQCGTSQKESNVPVSIPKVVDPRTIQKVEGLFGFNISKQMFGFFLVWVLIHFVLLLVNWKSSEYAGDYFWPINDESELEHYDFPEFLFYTIVPLVVLIIFNLIMKPTVNTEVLAIKYDLTYKKDQTPTVVGIILALIISFFYVTNYPNFKNFDDLPTSLVIFNGSIFLILRVILIIWVLKIAKSLNRDSDIWGVFALFFPALALIIIGQMKKLRKDFTIEEQKNNK